MNKTAKTGTGTKKTTKTSGADAGLPFLGEFAPADISEMLAANRAVVDEMVAMNHQIGAFVSKRMQADIDAMTRLSQCKDWPQMMGVQVEFMSTLAEDYFAEANRVMERATRMIENGPSRTPEAKKK